MCGYHVDGPGIALRKRRGRRRKETDLWTTNVSRAAVFRNRRGGKDSEAVAAFLLLAEEADLDQSRLLLHLSTSQVVRRIPVTNSLSFLYFQKATDLGLGKNETETRKKEGTQEGRE